MADAFSDLTPETFNPQVYTDESTSFSLFGTSVTAGNRWAVEVGTRSQDIKGVHITYPFFEGGKSFNIDKGVITFPVTIKMHTMEYSEELTFVTALTTALLGRSAGTAGWPTGHFRFFTHEDGGVNFYFNKCVVVGAVRWDPAARNDAIELRSSSWSNVSFDVRCNDPAQVYNGDTAAPGTTVIVGPTIVSGSFIVRQADTLDVVAVIDPSKLDTDDYVTLLRGGLRIDVPREDMP